jgi:hypothetical protein
MNGDGTMTKIRLLITAAMSTVLLSACAGGTAADSTDAGPTLPTQSAEESASPEPSTPAGPSTNARGNIVKAVGEEGGFTDLATDQPVITFAIDAIAPAQCSADYEAYGSPPENGHLISVSLRFATAPELANTELGSYFTVSAYDFQFIGADNITHTNLGTIAAYSCLDQTEQFTQGQLGPGQQYVGKLVLDVPAPNGTLVYKPSSTGGLGWEIPF